MVVVMMVVPDEIARAVINVYNDTVPTKAKPRNGEWTTVAGIVAVDDSNRCTVLSVATGVKATADRVLQSQQSQGCILHDCHAEILALRGFNRYLLEAIHRIQSGNPCPFDLHLLKDNQNNNKYSLSGSIKLVMYVSHIPCGDASMEMTMAAQQDPTPWTTTTTSTPTTVVRGRDNFNLLGYVRTKPGRRDSPCSLSKSCTDKLMIRQYLSVLNCMTSNLLVDPVYLDTLVLSCSDPDLVRGPVHRGFHARPLAHLPPVPPYKYTPFNIAFSTISLFPNSSGTSKPSNISGVWYYHQPQVECLVNGIKMGSGMSRLPHPSGLSNLCRRQQFSLFTQITCSSCSYIHIKESNQPRVLAKLAVVSCLVGSPSAWLCTAPDSDFSYVD